MFLTERLQKIYDKIPQVKVLADVGCDHGYIGNMALVEKRAEFVHFCDISRPSLRKAQELAGKLKHRNCDFICQDGLGKLQVDCAVIAGMGGMEIISILQKAQHLPQTLVLQPMQSQPELRSFLCENYHIDVDYMFIVQDKRYDLIVATRGSDTLDELQLEFGKTNLVSPSQDFIDMLKYRRLLYSKVIVYSQHPMLVKKLNTVIDLLTKFQGEKWCKKKF